MKWNLRMVAAQRDIWRPVLLLEAFKEVGFTPSLSKVAAMWGGQPVTVRLDDLDKICAALDCTVADLMQAETAAILTEHDESPLQAAVGQPGARPVPRTPSGGQRRSLPPN
ncbi:helix-turn-helix transcriptional regulator [Streptomyces sp. NPDC052101]|uniref:helix-turn-helix domain-containing protein n=1 Tax=Streptomyces sp. NPDC052101 TaxID=3155763 RepID=UPI00343E73AF